jgi:hypothetical protein
MLKNISFFFIIIIVLFCSACSNDNDQQIIVDKQSYVRWSENDNNLEVYAVVSNPTKKDVSFEATLVIQNQNLEDAVGFETLVLETDDRSGRTPFILAPNYETVFKRDLKTNGSLTKEMLSNGVGIKISISNNSFIIPISYSEIED